MLDLINLFWAVHDFLSFFILESPIGEEISLTTNRYHDFSKNLNNRIDNLKLADDYMQLLNDGRNFVDWEDQADVRLDQTRPTSSEPDTLAQEISVFRVCLDLTLFICGLRFSFFLSSKAGVM